MKKKLGIDSFRLIMALLIVMIHTYPFTSISEDLNYVLVNVLCRIGVPFFFMVTGYFVLTKALKDKNELIKYTFNILKIYGFTILLYVPLNIYTGYFHSNNLWNIIKDVIFNGTFYHLWYFPALILGVWITYFLIKKLKENFCFMVVTCLYILGLLGDSYYGLNLLNGLYNLIFKIFDYTRNGIFYAPIFLYLGYWIRKHNFKTNYTKCKLLCCFILLVLEGLVLKYFNLQRHDSMYIVLIPLMMYLFSLIIKNVDVNKKLRDMSLVIYIIHPWIIVIIRAIAKLISLQAIMIDNSLVHYVLVVIGSVICGFIYNKIKHRLN